MHSPYEPSEIRSVLDEYDAGVGRGRVARTVRNVVEAKQETGYELDRDENRRHTAKVSVGAGRIVGNPAVELCVDRIHELEALVEPIDNAGLQSHRANPALGGALRGRRASAAAPETGTTPPS